MTPLGLCDPIHDCNEVVREVDCSVRGMLFAMKRRGLDGSLTANSYFRRVASIECRWCWGLNKARKLFDTRLCAKMKNDDKQTKTLDQHQNITNNDTDFFAYLTAWMFPMP